jgi:predicted HTH domain antitoxin
MISIQDFIRARLYESEEAVIRDALRYLLRERPDLRIALAVYRYEAEGLSLSRAAALAGVSWAQMKQVLLERGLQPRLGPETQEEAGQEVATLRRYFGGKE